MILSEAGRLISHTIFKALETTTANADRLGISGANTYYCNNYTSPLHRDNDAASGLCAQYHLQAKSDLCEYSFIYADYGIYFVSRSNSLWYVIQFEITQIIKYYIGPLLVLTPMALCFHPVFP